MKKLSRTSIIAIIIVFILIAAFASLLPVYLKSTSENRELYEDQKIRIQYKDELIGEYTFSELVMLSPSVEFEATFKPSSLPAPIIRNYNGIFLKDLFSALDIDADSYSMVLFEAQDGLQKTYTKADILEEGNVYIANKVNGKPFNKGINSLSLSDPQEDGGPYVVIKAKDSVSQNRVKLLVEINII